MTQIDNKKMWESLLRWGHLGVPKDAIVNALKEQGLEYKDGVIVKIEPKKEESIHDPYSLPVGDDSNLLVFDESKYHPCTEEQETEEMVYFKKAIADIVDYSRKHADVTPELFVDRFMKHVLDIAKLALKQELYKEYERGCKQAIDDALDYINNKLKNETALSKVTGMK